MKKLLVLVVTLFFAFNLYAQSRGMREVAEANLGNKVNIGKQYALFIAIDAYKQWTPLKKPVSDAKEIRDILQKDYYIDEVIELYNAQATKQNITKMFTDLQNKLGVHDSLFIYYAGHGHYDKNSDQGFWIPVDGGTDIYSQDNWLPNSQIRGYISRFKTIHVFMVSDACFSGDILNTTRSLQPQIDNDYFRKAYTLTSRQVLTSGSSETVPDQSEFSAAFMNSLRKNTEPLIDPLGIFNDVRRSVRNTTPLYGSLNAANHQEGATFIFFRKQTPVAVTPTPTPTPTPAPVYGIDPNAIVPELGGRTATGNNSNEVITGSWETNKDNNSNVNTIINKEIIDGKEYDVLTININLAGKNPSWAGALLKDWNIIQKLRKANGVRFKALGDGKKWSVYFATPDVKDNAFHETIITTQNGKVSGFDIPFSNLKQPAWGKKINFYKDTIQTIAIQRNFDLGAGASNIKIFDFEIY